MPALTLIFARARSLGSLALRVLGNSRWSHVAVVDGSHVIEARMVRGVVRTPMADFLARYSHTELLEVQCPDPTSGLSYARSRIGCGYDYGALLGMLLHRGDLDASERDYCASLAEDAIAHAGRQRIRGPRRHRITVETSYMVI